MAQKRKSSTRANERGNYMRNSNSIAKGIAAILVAGVLAAGVCCTGFASRGDDGKWFGNGNLSTWHWNDEKDNKTDDKTGGEETVDFGGAVIGDITGNGISLLSAEIPLAAYAENGISPQAESAYTLTATITPASADNKSVTWTIAPKSGNANWSEYITLTANGLTATVACKKDFDVQFIVTVQSVDNPNAKATCTLDYVQRVTGITVNMPKMTSTTVAATYTVESSKYTIAADMQVVFSNFKLNDDFFITAEDRLDELGGYDLSYSLCTPYAHHNSAGQFQQEVEGFVKYTNNGVEFQNLADHAGDTNHCPDNIIGSFFFFDKQAVDMAGYTEHDCYAIIRSLFGEKYIGTVDVTVSSLGNGTATAQVKKTVELWVDGASLHIPVTGISLSNNSLVF